MARLSNYADRTDEDDKYLPNGALPINFGARTYTPTGGRDDGEGGGNHSTLGENCRNGDWSWKPPHGVPDMTDMELNKHLLAKYPGASLGVPPPGEYLGFRFDPETLREKRISQAEANMPLSKMRWWTLNEYQEFWRGKLLAEARHAA